jgi:hypothetical protein
LVESTTVQHIWACVTTKKMILDIFYSIKQFVKMTLHCHCACSLVYCHCSRAAGRIRACSLVSCHCSRVAEQNRACSLVSCHCIFGILPLQQGSRTKSCMQFGILSLHYSNCSLRTSCCCSMAAACACMQFGILSLWQGSSTHSCMQFCIMPVQRSSSAHSCMQFDILLLHYSDCNLRN